ncbi:tautomerase family protein [Nocardioides daphniae]|nr:tautomerase family protein [Nocardioides daphniae]QCC78490.1 tautomerase family protein [Nocardioides daphniae]
MPSTVVEIRRPYAPEEEVTIIDAVHASLVEAFRIPEGDKHVRLVVHEPHRCAVPPHLSDPDRFTLVQVDCFAGRSVDAKRQLYAALTAHLGDLGIPADHVTVVVRDLPLESWGIRAGQAACDVDLGFHVNV